MVEIRVNTPKMRSVEAHQRITEMLPYMERVGRLKHGVMLPFGMDASQLKAGDQLWQPWNFEERNYLRGVRNIFAHARCAVLEDGSLRVRDNSRLAPGEPELDGFHFDKSTTDWEWTSREFQDFSQRLGELVFQRFQCSIVSIVSCHTCGQSVDASDYLTCEHVEYAERSDRNILGRKPKGATLRVTASLGYRDDTERLEGSARKGVVTYDGLDRMISSLESMDEIAEESKKEGAPIYVVIDDEVV